MLQNNLLMGVVFLDPTSEIVMHNSLKEQHQGQGLAGVLTLLETGQQLTLNFEPGVFTKAGSLVIGSMVVEVEFKLVPRKPEQDIDDMTLVIEPRPLPGAPKNAAAKPARQPIVEKPVQEERTQEVKPAVKAAPAETPKLKTEVPLPVTVPDAAVPAPAAPAVDQSRKPRR